ncbi:MAG: HAMP domain-containing protein [Alphaproteobacteria bacterium]|jgi:two-component system sensor histidine kinase ChvG|nr:HAMP domain-containing protein [Alphaproteobacteria bacterium]
MPADVPSALHAPADLAPERGSRKPRRRGRLSALFAPWRADARAAADRAGRPARAAGDAGDGENAAPESGSGAARESAVTAPWWSGAHRRRRPLSKLTARVLAINVLALILLLGGLLFLGNYEEQLIQSELESLQTEALTFAGALAEGALVDDPAGRYRLDPAKARQIVRRLHETTETRTRLFDAAEDGLLLADSRMLAGPGGTIEITPLPPPDDTAWPRQLLNAAYDGIVGLFPERKQRPVYREQPEQHGSDYSITRRALNGDIGRQIWATDGQDLLLGVAVPVQRLRVVLGTVLLTRDSGSIKTAVQSVREQILVIFAGVLAVTVLMSLYLAGSITTPIRKLAQAADRVRGGKTREHEIPDFTHRRDEIGELSGALREMTAALWNRMDANERFAADVAHELKNPLTSVRSAVETATRIQDPERQRQLMAIIQEDVKRLDRLISDISDSSRLDTELSRAESAPVDLRRMLEMLAELHAATGAGAGAGEDERPAVGASFAEAGPLIVRGLEGRLVQVFRNLISNAVTFSPPGGRIALAARREGGEIVATVEDEGPGIPEGKLAAIFDRFYTERPAGEKFGTHSGLGLSISKQIIDAHGGSIRAENRRDRSGARFIVRLPAG